MADPKEECIVISDEEPGAEIISSDDESSLSNIARVEMLSSMRLTFIVY